MKRYLLGLFIASCASLTMAAQITGVRSYSDSDSTRLVLELDGPVDYQVDDDSIPGRLLLDLPRVTTSLDGASWPTRKGLIDAVRLDTSAQVPRLAIDLRQDADAKVFALPGNPYRLVVDLANHAAATPKATAPVVSIPARADTSAPASTSAPRPAMVIAPPDDSPPLPTPGGKGRNIIVTIDAGHGGEDPGATGPGGHHEKMVTLAIATALANYLNTQPGITANLTRDADFFIPLQRRHQIARYDRHADIFVSIHADSAPSRAARGSSVFALSLKGANTATSRFAAQLADQQNKSDLLGGISAQADDDIGGLLASMLVEGTLTQSLKMGRMILRHLEPTVGTLHSHNVEQAGFAVLKEPGMVSVLVETGFISNPGEESRLTSSDYQQAVAQSIGDGVVEFCRRYPVPGTWFARD